MSHRFRPRSILPIPPLAVLLLSAVASIASGWAGPDGRIIENRGQLPDPVRYYAYSGEATLYFTGTGVVIDLPARGHAIRMRFVDARPDSRLEPRNPQRLRLNSYTGSDPERWKSDLRVFADLVYRDLWPGADLIFNAEEGELRYRILTAGGSKTGLGPWEHRFTFEGTDGITTTAAGLTQLELSGGTLTEGPVASDGADRSLRWGAGARTHANSSKGGDDFDRDNPSTLAWSTYLGGADNDYSHGLALDSFQRPIVTGYTRSANFPTTLGAYDRAHAGSYDVFVAKLDAAGSALIWGTFLGGGLEDRPFALAVDAADEVVVAGHTFSSDFPTTVNAYDRSLNGTRDAFVAKLNASGSVLQWSTYLGGSSFERAWALALDPDGRAIVAGETGSVDYPTTAAAFDTTLGGSSDGFVAVLDAGAQTLVGSTFLGGSSADWVNGLVLDSLHRPVLVGTTYSNDYPTTSGAHDPTPNGGWDGFLTKLDPQGNSPVFSSYLGGSGTDVAFGVDLNASGQAVVGGSTSSPDFPVTPGACDVTYNGAGDIFVAQFDSSGSSLLWNSYVGGSGLEESFALILDPSGCAVVSGETSSSDFPTTTDALDRSYAGNQDAFVTRVSSTGNEALWSTYLGGAEFDSGWDFALDTSGNPLLTGPTRSADFPTTAGAYDRSYSGGLEDAFLLRLAIPPVAAANPPAESVHLYDPMLRAGPNPFRESLQLHLNLPQPATVSLLVLDAAGRRVASVASGLRPAGVNSMVWSGRDVQNRPLHSGVYWLRLEAGPTVVQTKVICAR